MEPASETFDQEQDASFACMESFGVIVGIVVLELVSVLGEGFELVPVLVEGFEFVIVEGFEFVPVGGFVLVVVGFDAFEYFVDEKHAANVVGFGECFHPFALGESLAVASFEQKYL